MSKWEIAGRTDEWYTPAYIFKALGVRFNMDVASPADRTHCSVPADHFISADSLAKEWVGFVWMNPPFGKRNSIICWLDKLKIHGDGIALTPDRTSCPWFKNAAISADAILFISGKVKFIKQDGTPGDSPSTGTALFAYGFKAMQALENARNNGLGILVKVLK